MSRWIPSPREAAVAIALVVAAIGFGRFVHRFYEIEAWLFWRLAFYWVASALWSGACFAVGHRIVRPRLRLPFYAHAAVAFATGVLVFGVAVFVAGALSLYRAPLFLGLPAVFLLVGGRGPWRYLADRWRRLSRLRRRLPLTETAFHLALVAFGLLGLGMLYFLILTPDNVAYDARWKHLALAEDFAITGGIRRFPEGWTFATRPHFASYLYTWAFLAPGRLFDHIEVAAHLEFVAFALTCWLGVPAVVRALLPKERIGWSVWAARFAFPGVFVYDSTLGCGADHIAAVFAAPVLVLLYRAWRDLDRGAILILALQLGAVVLVKYTAAILLATIPMAALGLRASWLIGRRARREGLGAARGPLTSLGLGLGLLLLVTTPLWLKNLLLYGDPLYPVLHAHFDSRPWMDRASYAFEQGYLAMRMWRPSRDLAGVKATLASLYEFSFYPNDWINHHGEVPVFGSLFTLLIPALLITRRRPWRLWGAVALVELALLPWYWLNHQDRYLQAFMPWMAGATAAMVIVLWRHHGRLVKAAVVGLVALQIVWGGDAYFFQTQVFIGSPQKWTLGLLEGGYRGSRERRFETQAPWPELGAVLPEGARVVLHDADRHLGLGRQAVMDVVPWQFGIDYGAQKTPAEMHALFASVGATHVFWPPSRRYGTENLAADLMFFDFVHNRAVDRRDFEFGTLVRISDQPDTRAFDDSTLAITCGEPLATGLYRAHDFWITSYGAGEQPYPKPRE
ncbi:MAG: hypothetical protein KC731_42505, partial [Myxococcales bacterium]|nr:hypothetical protein [Myxococcales bacterium]